MMTPLTDAQLARFYAAKRCHCGAPLNVDAERGFTCRECGRVGEYSEHQRGSTKVRLYECSKGAV